MPACSSSPIDPAIGHLASLADDAEDSPGLLAVLARMADPRHRRGMRHRLAVILGLAVTNEIPLFSTLCDSIAISGAVITAGALHAQREHARYLARRGAHYVITIKRNQPGLHAQLAALPWRDVPEAYDKRERGHGRREHRKWPVAWPSRTPPGPSRSCAPQTRSRPVMTGRDRGLAAQLPVHCGLAYTTCTGPIQRAKWVAAICTPARPGSAEGAITMTVWPGGALAGGGLSWPGA